MVNKLSVGDKIYLRPINNAARHGEKIIETEVSKVGNKFFYVSYGRSRFLLDSLIQDGGQYSPNYKAYVSKQQIEDEDENLWLNVQVRNKIKTATLSTEKLKSILQILQD